MNPIEQIWKKIRKRGFHNEVFASLEKVVERLCDTICSLSSATFRTVLVAVRRAVPFHRAPAGLRSHPVHFRFAGNLINRDAGNIRYEIPGLILFFMVESSFKV